MYVGTDVNYKGKILQVVPAINNTVTNNLSRVTIYEVISVDITPKSNNSLMQIKAMLSIGTAYVKTFMIYKNGTKLISPTGNTGSDNGGGLTTFYSQSIDTGNGSISVIPIIYNDSNDQFNTITYSIRVAQDWDANTGSAWAINSRNSNDMGSASTMSVWEYQL